MQLLKFDLSANVSEYWTLLIDHVTCVSDYTRPDETFECVRCLP